MQRGDTSSWWCATQKVNKGVERASLEPSLVVLRMRGRGKGGRTLLMLRQGEKAEQRLGLLYCCYNFQAKLCLLLCLHLTYSVPLHTARRHYCSTAAAAAWFTPWISKSIMTRKEGWETLINQCSVWGFFFLYHHKYSPKFLFKYHKPVLRYHPSLSLIQ